MRELIANYAAGKIKLLDLPESLKKIPNINETLSPFKHLHMVFRNYTALEFAVRIKDIELIKVLIIAGADINHGVYKALLVAADNLSDPDQAKSDQYFDILKLLLADGHKADINIRAENGENILFYSAKKGRADVVEFLLEQPKININILSIMDLPPIFVAVQYGHLRVVEKLCHAGVDLSTQPTWWIDNNKQKSSTYADVFVTAIERNHISIISLLLKYTEPSDLCWEHIYNARDCKGLKLLLDCGVDPNTITTARSKTGNLAKTTLIQRASTTELYDFVTLLLPYRADPNILYSDGQTLLCALASVNQTKIMDILLKSRKIKNINQADEDKNKQIPLHIAACHGHYEAAKLLLKYGANPRLQNGIGFYPLNYIILNESLALIPLFKAELDLPLGIIEVRSIFHALFTKDTKLVTCLCTNGANPDWIKGDPISPLFLAIALQKIDMLNILLHFGANPNRDYEDCCPASIKLAIDLNDSEAVKMLIKQTNFIIEPYFLYSAIEKNFTDIVKVMIHNGFDPLAGKTPSADLTSPLFHAFYLNREESIAAIVDYLKQNNRLIDLKKHIIVYLIRLESFIDDNDLIFQIRCKLNNILRSLSVEIKSSKTQKTEPEKIEAKSENWNPEIFSTNSTHISISSRRYLSEEHGWTLEKFKTRKEELKFIRKKRQEISVAHTGNSYASGNFV